MEETIDTADAFDTLVDVSASVPDVVVPPAVAPPAADPEPAPETPRDEHGRFAKPEASTEAAPEAPKAAKPRNDPQARIDELTRLRRDAERRAEDAERRARDLEARMTPKPEPPKPAPKADLEPDPTNLQTYPEGQYDRKFLADQARWAARQELQHVQRTQQEHAASTRREQQFHTRAAALRPKIQAAVAKDPEFLQKIDQRLYTTLPASVLGPNEPVTFDNFLVEQILDVDDPEAVLLHLSQPDVYQRLATLPPAQVIRELVRFDTGHGAASPDRGSAPASKPVTSQAKPPIRPLDGSPPAADPYEITDDLSVDEHIRRANAIEERTRRARR